jgi:hypothetical protein
MDQKPETSKLLDENMRETLQNTGIDNNFLNRTPIAQGTKAIVDKWDYIKLKSFFRVGRQPTE